MEIAAPGSRCPSEQSTDRELLIRFSSGDPAAFSEAVRRHSGLVFHVCQRILGSSADAEDAYQATFLVLARRARFVKWEASIAGWLHQTARRTALKLKTLRMRRRAVEAAAAQQQDTLADRDAGSPEHPVAVRELGTILDDELSALPARFREVILLCHVEGLSRDEAAGRLGITLATVKDRLERGRDQLRSRLVRRGVSLTSVTLAAWLLPGTVQAAHLTNLAATTAHAAGAFAAGSLSTGLSPAVTTLTHGVLKMLGFEKFRSAALWAVSLLTAGGVAFGMLRDEPGRFEKGLRGQVVAVNVGTPTTVTIALEEWGTLLNLDVSAKAEVWTAFEPGQVSHLNAGQFVSLRLGEDHRTVTGVHIQGPVREASIQSVAAPDRILIVEGDDDDGNPAREVELAPDVILRIGGLPASRIDLKPGMQVPLEFGRDGKRVHAIEAEAVDGSLTDGELRDIDSTARTLILGREENDDGLPTEQSFPVPAEAIITLDGKPAGLSDLKRGSSLKLRLSENGQILRVLQATSPEADEAPESDDP